MSTDERPLSDEDIFRALSMGGRLIAIEQAIGEVVKALDDLKGHSVLMVDMYARLARIEAALLAAREGASGASVAPTGVKWVS